MEVRKICGIGVIEQDALGQSLMRFRNPAPFCGQRFGSPKAFLDDPSQKFRGWALLELASENTLKCNRQQG
jgi:hypothetical protein